MLKRLSCVGLVVGFVLITSGYGDVVALKRDSGLDTSGPIDARFLSATVEQVTVGDSGIYGAGNSRWYNGGITAVVGNSDVLVKFDLTTVSQLIGGDINLAELRIYHTSGNTWGSGLYRITTHDWIEGTVDYNYPGAAGGVSFAHPIGYNTGPEQDASGGTTPPLQTWGVGSDSFFAALGDCDMICGVKSTVGGAGYTVWDVTDIVQSWVDGANNYGLYLDNSNYGINLSEAGSMQNPVLFIDYIPAAPPTDITDLATGTVDWFMVELTWTAPSDQGGPGGGAYEYDIRYSTSPIDAGNWDSATQCTGEPTPAAPDTTESYDVTGLNPNTQYYFAIKSGDDGGLWSNLSNVPSTTTSATDAVAPDAVSDLATSVVMANRVTLSWTASGDDGATGTASVYDVRYSTSPIDAGNFGSATQCTGEPTPQAAGNSESFIVTGLNPQTQYWFALKVGDEVPNWSGISNVPNATTPVQDTTPPDAVTDLAVAPHIHMVTLSWTAPDDTGSGVASYDIRYSTSPIDAGNWGGATQCTGEPSPAAPSTPEQFIVLNLASDTTYYFAIKSTDLAEPPNVSALSNVASGMTLAEVQPVSVINPWIVSDRVADCRTITTIANTFVNSYQPDGVTAPLDDEDKAINCYNNYKRRTYHWAYQPPDMWDTVNVINNFGWVLCGRHASHNCTILSNVPGMGHRQIGLPGHWIYEAYYDGAWHAFCTMTTMYTYNRAVPPAITSCAEYDADETLMLNAVAEGRACPGFLLCGDTPEWYADAMHSWSDSGSGVSPTDHSMDVTIPVGQSVDRTWEAWQGQTFDAGGDAHYHHEAQHDWKDYINYPYWEPYGAVISYIEPTKTTYRRWANGTVVLQPDFRSPAYQACLESSTNIRTYNDDGQSPDLHLAATGAAEVIFKIDTPFMVTGGTISGTFYRNDAGDANRIYIATDGVNYTQVWTNPTLGTTALTDLSLDNYLWGGMAAASIPVPFGVCYIKVELDADGSITDAGVSDLEMNVIFEHNKGAMAYLDKGTNNITVTFDNPLDLDGSGASFKVVYSWKEYDGADWTIDKSQTQYITTSPTNFSITTGGSKVPRTESIKLELTTPPLPDGTPPGAISDLDALNPDATTIDLTFTAPGDDGFTGRATWYDARYNSVPITEGNWDSCTEVVGEPAPQTAGNTEYFTVTGLSPSTTYYFAIKTYDEGNQGSDLSNVDSETTQPPDVTAPAAISNLAAATGTQAGTVDLTWTAPGDDGMTGTAQSYDIRYSTSSIDEGNWASATEVTGEPAPQAGGSAESFTVTGLTIGQTYYVAIKTSDEVPNESGLSNVPSATAQLGEMTLQGGGVTDNYMSAYNPDINYGSFERMIVTGYEDQGPTNRQRGLVRFDLSSVPTGTPITVAMLYLYSYEPLQTNGSAGYYGAYRLTTNWSATSSTWNSPWSTAGGDFEATADATAPKQSVANVWYAFNVTSRVQAWINNGGTDNYGWLIKCTDEMLHNQDYFYQTDTSNASYRPKLFITDLAPDTIAPAAITDLAAATGSQSASVDLTWTAPGDDGTSGTATSYDVRYSTATITEGNWDSATPVSGAPAPQSAGSPESFTATNLPTGQTLYFAIKTSDEMLNESDLSNVASADSVLGVVTLQNGLAGYSGTEDTYLSAGGPDSAYGDGYDRMTVTGYADLGPENVNRGLVKFDLTGIPAGTVITSAKLWLYSYDDAQAMGSTGFYGAYRLTTNWVENSATWNSSDTGVPWTTAGGDFEATPDGTVAKQTGGLIWYTIDVTTRVQDWIDNPANNLGWIIKCTDEDLHNQDRFYQSEGLNAGNRPKLIVQDVGQYIVSTSVNPTCTGEVTGGGDYGTGETCYVTAVPYEHSTFVDWTGGPIDGSTNPNESFTVTEDVSITANFQMDAGYISVCDYATLKQAVTTDAQPGDVILVQPGVYQMNEDRLSVYNAGLPGNPITIRGVMNGSQRPILEPVPGQEVNRGFFHFWDTDQYWVIENLEFRNLRGFDVLYSTNAAACYVTGDDITIRNCYFHDNDQGLSGATGSDNVLVENCEFYNNGSDLNLGYTHGLYMMNDDLTVRGCYFHDGYGGMLFKVRCLHHVLEYNWLETDGSEAFVAAASSSNANNGLWRGNV
ncbi:MAG TPA: DNRLRE domain-containing protein, partial [Phycisphaerae bacterium]|nr:DNRLRE domain-containing protein [Phycisphaerae bacterium]